MTTNETEPVTYVSINDIYYDVSNVKEFTKATIAQMAKVVAFNKTSTWIDEESDKEMTAVKMYFYVTINTRTKPTRLNKFTKDNLAKAFKSNDPRKWLGKTVIATHSKIGKNEFITWKAETKID